MNIKKRLNFLPKFLTIIVFLQNLFSSNKIKLRFYKKCLYLLDVSLNVGTLCLYLYVHMYTFLLYIQKSGRGHIFYCENFSSKN